MSDRERMAQVAQRECEQIAQVALDKEATMNRSGHSEEMSKWVIGSKKLAKKI